MSRLWAVDSPALQPLHGCAVLIPQKPWQFSKLNPSVLARAAAPAESFLPKPLPAIFLASAMCSLAFPQR